MHPTHSILSLLELMLVYELNLRRYRVASPFGSAAVIWVSWSRTIWAVRRCISSFIFAAYIERAGGCSQPPSPSASACSVVRISCPPPPQFCARQRTVQMPYPHALEKVEGELLNLSVLCGRLQTELFDVLGGQFQQCYNFLRGRGDLSARSGSRQRIKPAGFHRAP